MRFFLPGIIAIHIVVGFHGHAYAQDAPSDQAIRTWTKRLAIANDTRAAQLNAVIREVSSLDKSIHCNVLDQLNAFAQKSNPRSRIRTRLLLHITGLDCPSLPKPVENLQAALQEAYAIEDEFLQYEIHLRLGQYYNNVHQYDLGALHYLLLFDILKRQQRSEFNLPSAAYFDMCNSQYHSHNYQDCIRTGLNALFALTDAPFEPDDSLTLIQRMQTWNTIGLAYNKLNQHDSAFYAFTKALQIAGQVDNSLWKGIIQGNKGDVFYNKGQYDSAYTLLQFDYEESMAADQPDNAANSLQWIARIDLKNNKPSQALDKLRTAMELLRQRPQPVYLENVYLAFTQAYAAAGQPDSVNTYLKRYLHLHDSLQAVITKSRTDILEMRLNNLDQVQTIKLLNRQKSNIATTRNFTIAIVLLLGCIAYLWLSRIWQKRQQEAIRGKQDAEAETEKAIAQLELFRQHLLEKNAEIEQYQSTHESREMSEEQLRRLSELTQHLILKEEDWLQFKALFESVYPGFFISLRNKIPDITQAEQRMAALSKLKLTVKEAANLLGVSPNTVYTTRRRLRLRLGLENENDLEHYLDNAFR